MPLYDFKPGHNMFVLINDTLVAGDTDGKFSWMQKPIKYLDKENFPYPDYTYGEEDWKISGNALIDFYDGGFDLMIAAKFNRAYITVIFTIGSEAPTNLSTIESPGAKWFSGLALVENLEFNGRVGEPGTCSYSLQGKLQPVPVNFPGIV
jgi:hypothetical protein